MLKVNPTLETLKSNYFILQVRELRSWDKARELAGDRSDSGLTGKPHFSSLSLSSSLTALLVELTHYLTATRGMGPNQTRFCRKKGERKRTVDAAWCLPSSAVRGAGRTDSAQKHWCPHSGWETRGFSMRTLLGLGEGEGPGGGQA